MNFLSFLKSNSIKLCMASTVLFNVACSTDGTEELDVIEESVIKEEIDITTSSKAPESIFSDVEYFTIETSAHQSGTSAEDFDSADEISGIYQGINRNGGYLYLNNQAGQNERTELKEISDRSLYDGVHGVYLDIQPRNIPNGTGVTIGQIHHRSFGDSRPLIRVYCTTSSVEIVRARTPIKADTSKDILGTMSFSDSDKLKMRLHMKGNGVVHAYVYNYSTGNSISTNEFIGDSNDAAWVTEGVDDYYFKVGVYNQGTNKAAHVNITSFDHY